MPVYHSAFNAVQGTAEVAGCPLLPVKTRNRGPAPSVDPADPMEDIVDEALVLFRANILFRNFEPQGSGDRVLMYLQLFIAQCLKRVDKKGKAEGTRELNALASSQHFIPGDAGWPLGSMLPAPKTSSEQETLRAYFKQLREALVVRLSERLYGGIEAGTPDLPNKHWMLFAKRKFMGKEFP